MYTPHTAKGGAPMSPIDHASAQAPRISLALSDLVSPGLKEYDDLESETRTSVTSFNDGTNYKKELKKLLTKARGTAYEATLRRFVEAKYSEIKKDEASNRKLFGSSRGAGAVGPPSVASLSTSKYDAPAPMTLREANALYFSGSSYQDGRIVENYYSTPKAQNTSRVAHTASPKASWAGQTPVSHRGYSILNESNITPKNVSLEVSYFNKTRIEEMAKPIPRNTYKGPPQVPYYSSTNHLGRQRPPPQTAKGASSAERKGSPYTSPYRARYGAFSSERSLAGNSTIGGSSTMAGDADGAASVATMPTFIQQALEQQQQRGERSYAEFQQWLTTNREWTRRREFKLLTKESEVLHHETHDFKPKIISKSVRLAAAANRRAFQRMTVEGANYSGDEGAQRRGRSRSRSRSPGAVFMHIAPPFGAEHDAHQSDTTTAHAAERPSWDLLKSAELLQEGSVASAGGSQQQRRDRSDSVTSTGSERSGSQRGVRRRHSSLNTAHSETSASHAHAQHLSTHSQHQQQFWQQPQDHLNLRAMSTDELSVHSAPSQQQLQHSLQNAHSQPATSTGNIAPPSDVFERLAARGRVQARKTHNYLPPEPQHTFTPHISERSARLAERKHQRDAVVRARSASAERPRTAPAADGTFDPAVDASSTGQFLSRNYDYYELYSMPRRYLERLASPTPYKHHGRQSESPKKVLTGSGLTKVAEKIASRSSSPVPVRAAGAESGGEGGDGAGAVAGAGAGAAASSTGSTTAPQTASAAANITIDVEPDLRPDEGRKYRTFSPSPRSASPGFSPSPNNHSASSANVSVFHVAKEAIRERRAMSRSKREQAVREFNQRHYLSKESKESKPFQPILMATETHKIMARVRSTFEERTTKAVEDQIVRREVARMFPSPGPGRYSGGIAIEKLARISVGSPVRSHSARTRSLSPVPGHRGFSFSREPLTRLDSPGRSQSPALGATLNSTKSAKSPAKADK